MTDTKTPHDCICGVINARHCPVHNDTKTPRDQAAEDKMAARERFPIEQGSSPVDAAYLRMAFMQGRESLRQEMREKAVFDRPALEQFVTDKNYRDLNAVSIAEWSFNMLKEKLGLK
jgi:hypothetical protein